MRMNKKQKWLLILILIILTFIYHNLILPKKEKEKYLNDTVETLNKEFNLKINKNNYKTVDAYFRGWPEIHYYRIEKRIKNQWEEQKKIELSTFVIENNEIDKNLDKIQKVHFKIMKMIDENAIN